MRIALIHAVRVAMQPVEDAFRRHWPDAERVNLLDDSLSVDRNRAGALTPQLSRRIAALADCALDGGADGILATFQSSISSLEAELPDIRVQSVCVPEAMAALQAGDGAKHDALLAAAAPQLDGCDAIMLAQFSTARAHGAVSAAVKCPVLASPDSAVLAMRKALQ